MAVLLGGGGGGLFSDKKWMLSNGKCLYGLSKESVPIVKLKLFMITVSVQSKFLGGEGWWMGRGVAVKDA